MDLTDFILIIFGLLIIYLIYKTRNLEKLSEELPNIEKFETSVEDAVNAKYTSHIDSFRNLASITQTILQENDSFIMPAGKTYFTDIEMSGITNMKGPVIIEGPVEIVNRDTVLLNLLPRYLIVAWAKDPETKPLGWAICDGNRYKIDETTKRTIFADKDDINSVVTPDLRGRFILGSGIGATDENARTLKQRLLGETGGTEEHTLIEAEMPVHNHEIIGYHDNYAHRGSANESSLKNADRGSFKITTSDTGGGKPHNNMPPFYVLTYIMKI